MVASERHSVDVRAVSRAFGAKLALDDVTLQVERGHVQALLGRNGAGKTTLLRILAGLLTPSSGSVHVAGIDAARSPLAVRRAIGLVPSGDRSFYLRISGFENLVFFARLQGLRRRAAGERALDVLAKVGLEDAARMPVGTYSHGMQKRLGVARALLTAPAVLLVDEATHDLDPEGAIAVRALVRGAANAGAAVVWATQRVEEIKDFADGVTVLDRGHTRFGGSVVGLLAEVEQRHYVLELRNGRAADRDLELRLQGHLEGVGSILRRPAGAPDSFVLALSNDAVLGDALSLLLDAGVTVVSCRQELSEVEAAFMAVVSEHP